MLKINSQINAQKQASNLWLPHFSTLNPPTRMPRGTIQAAEEIGETNNVESAELLEVKDALDRASTRLEASRAEALELRRRLEEIEEVAETRRRDDEVAALHFRAA